MYLAEPKYTKPIKNVWWIGIHVPIKRGVGGDWVTFSVQFSP